MKEAYFERFTLPMPDEAISDCHHQGQCDEDVDYWSTRVPRPEEITSEKLAAELAENLPTTPRTRNA